MRISDWSSDVCSSDLLTTNALKYGALRASGGRLDIGWTTNIGYRGNCLLDFTWTEQGVPAIPVRPGYRGFGMELIKDALPYRLGAETQVEFLGGGIRCRSEEHTSELQSLMRISYAVFCLKKKKINNHTTIITSS